MSSRVYSICVCSRATRSRIAGSRSASGFSAFAVFSSVRRSLRHRDRLARAADALLAERAHRDEPAVALVAEPVADRDLHVGEEHLAEQRVAGDLADRADVDAGQLHVDDERGDALVLAAARDRGRVGAERNSPHFAICAERDPDLLAVDDVVRLVVGEDRGRAQVREVGAGLRFGEALAPVLGGVEDAGQPARLLVLGAPRDDRRADLHDAVGVVDAGRAVLRHHLRVDDLTARWWRRGRPTPRARGSPPTGLRSACAATPCASPSRP